MTRETIACPVQDLSSFAKSLRSQLHAHLLAARPPADALPGLLPSHLQLLNMLARAAGHRNLQALQAGQVRAAGPTAPAPLGDTAQRALRQFDAAGRLQRWPTRFAVQRHAIWGLWLHFDAKRVYTEREVNTILQAWHGFGDHCTLRRELVTMGLLERTPDGAEYRKCQVRPEAEVAALLRVLRERGRAAGSAGH